MQDKKQKVWINMNDSVVDLSVLQDLLLEENITLSKVRTFDEKEIIELAKSHDALISASETWNEEMFNRLDKKGMLIAKYGAGINNIDLDSATKHGVYVSNLPGANANAVAEIALLHILNVSRQFTKIVEDTKNKGWPGTVEGTEIDGKVIGLYGYGNISKNLIKKLSGFDVEFVVYDKYAKEFAENIIIVDTKEELFKKSNIVSLHIPLTEETYEVVDKNLLNLLGSDGFLINTCRGEVVNQNDLVYCLENDIIAGAGVDVLNEEPPTDESIYNTKNLYVTSHAGAATRESEERSQKMLAETIVAYLKHNELKDNILNKETK